MGRRYFCLFLALKAWYDREFPTLNPQTGVNS